MLPTRLMLAINTNPSNARMHPAVDPLVAYQLFGSTQTLFSYLRPHYMFFEGYQEFGIDFSVP